MKCLWDTVGEIMKLHISWHHIVLGLDENNAENVHTTGNIILSIVVYAIFPSWVNVVKKKNLIIKVNWFRRYFSYVEILTIKLI